MLCARIWSGPLFWWEEWWGSASFDKAQWKRAIARWMSHKNTNHTILIVSQQCNWSLSRKDRTHGDFGISETRKSSCSLLRLVLHLCKCSYRILVDAMALRHKANKNEEVLAIDTLSNRDSANFGPSLPRFAYLQKGSNKQSHPAFDWLKAAVLICPIWNWSWWESLLKRLSLRFDVGECTRVVTSSTQQMPAPVYKISKAQSTPICAKVKTNMWSSVWGSHDSPINRWYNLQQECFLIATCN